VYPLVIPCCRAPDSRQTAVHGQVSRAVFSPSVPLRGAAHGTWGIISRPLRVKELRNHCSCGLWVRVHNDSQQGKEDLVLSDASSQAVAYLTSSPIGIGIKVTGA
jgi:hypothetical protein